jgi:hypothetical protein
LVECLKRQEAHARTSRPPKWQEWARSEHDATTKCGPLYGCGEWFGDVPEYMRQRYRRAIDELARKGLLEKFGTDRRIQSIKLTPAGEALAKQLLGTAASKRPHHARTRS